MDRLLDNKTSSRSLVAWLRYMIPVLISGLSPAFAEALTHPFQRGFWSTWNLNPFILLSLLVMGLLYAYGVWILWRQAGVGKGLSRWQVMSFYSGLYALLIALVSPLDTLSHTLFSGHMAQHMVLVLIAAPLLVYGAPLFSLLWALPRDERVALGRWWNGALGVRRFWTLLTQPPIVWCLFAVILWIWHIPSLYQAALENPLVHFLEHASLIFTAYLFWWLVIQPLGRRQLGFGAAILFVFTASVQSTILGAFITLAPQPFYPIYELGAKAWNVSPLADQQLAGFIMRMPMALVFFFTIMALFLLMLRDTEQRASPLR